MGPKCSKDEWDHSECIQKSDDSDEKVDDSASFEPFDWPSVLQSPQKLRHFEKKNAVHILIDLPGWKKEEVTVQMEYVRTLVVRPKLQGDGKAGPWEKRFDLPETALGNKIKARMENGLLWIIVLKMTEEEKIDVHIE